MPSIEFPKNIQFITQLRAAVRSVPTGDRPRDIVGV